MFYQFECRYLKRFWKTPNNYHVKNIYDYICKLVWRESLWNKGLKKYKFYSFKKGAEHCNKIFEDIFSVRSGNRQRQEHVLVLLHISFRRNSAMFATLSRLRHLCKQNSVVIPHKSFCIRANVLPLSYNTKAWRGTFDWSSQKTKTSLNTNGRKKCRHLLSNEFFFSEILYLLCVVL